MMKLAFLGLGAMGQRMAERLIDAGHSVTVWNRSGVKVDLFAGKSVAIANSPLDAARGADVVFSMLRDDAASRHVWLGPQGAIHGMEPNGIAVDCSTLSLGHMAALKGAFAEKNLAFVDAPVAGSRPQAEAGGLIFLCGGADQSLEHLQPVLSQLGALIHHAGPIGAGTAAKLMVNALFGSQLAMAAELLGLIKAAGFDASKIAEIVGLTPVCSPALVGSMAGMLSGAFAPNFPIDLVEKDFGLVAESGLLSGADLPMVQASRAVFAQAKAEGLGDLNITGIAKQYLS